MGSVSGYGLTVTGLPGEWPRVELVGGLDVRWSCRSGAVRGEQPSWFIETAAGCTVAWRYEARYEVAARVPVVLDVERDAIGEREAALMAVLSVLPLSLPMFGLEPFHGAALELASGGALLVLGDAEAGKSTTAANLRAFGLGFLADDASAVDAQGFLWPGPPLLAARLPEEVPEAFAHYDGKTVVGIQDHDASPREVRRIYVLKPSEDPPTDHVELIGFRGADAVRELLRNVRAPWCMPSRRQGIQFEAASRLARCGVAMVRYSKGHHHPHAVAKAILEHARGG